MVIEVGGSRLRLEVTDQQPRAGVAVLVRQDTGTVQVYRMATVAQLEEALRAIPSVFGPANDGLGGCDEVAS